MMDNSPTQTTQEDTLIEFPCHINVRVMGNNLPEFREQVIAIAKKHDANFDPEKISSKNSRTGKYISLTFSIYSENKPCLDAVYQDLNGCELVQWTL